MNQKTFILVGTALCSLFTTANLAFAQGSAFTYQGRFQDNGSLATGTYDLAFSLYTNSAGGAPIAGPVTNSGIAVSNGLFTVTIDFGLSVWNGTSNWLEIAVETNGGMGFVTLTPRQAVTPAPYAIFAEGADAAGLNGTIPMGSLGGTYGSAVNLTNVSNSFFGNGSGLTGVNAASLNGLGAGNMWQTAGNGGTTPGVNFVGTTDNKPLELHVNGARVLRVEPGGPAAAWGNGIPTGSPNMIGGASLNYVSNGVVGAVIAGGGTTNYGGAVYSNSVTADFGFIGGGVGNVVSENGGVIGGGGANTASGVDSTIGGGDRNIADSFNATVGGGEANIASYYSTVGGGIQNQASGSEATAGGGEENTASGNWATIPGGYSNNAAGEASFAAGYRAQAVNNGSFVWADDQNAPFSSTANNQFSVRASGGVLFAADVTLSGGAAYHNLSLSGGNSVGYLYGSYPGIGDGVHLGYNFYYDANGAGHVLNVGGGTSRISADYGEIILAVGGVNKAPANQLVVTTAGVSVYGTFNNFSDRNAKQGFAPVSPSEILDRVLRLPLSEWSYKADAATRHIGPMAQDFYGAFDVGTDDKHIAPIDEGGVALAAIQGLNQKLLAESKAKDAEIKQLKKSVSELKALMSQLAQNQAK
ncbi:MAG TPA: tail fiber domain-containing protein [Verrucomicrobiae bacterium]|nr:tail fiber domain-containing protein [Verrucomicrobiae bacterium]